MASCSMCGNWIPDGQNVCSMCYGDPYYGNDGYYLREMEREDERQMEERAEREAEEDPFSYTRPPTEYTDDDLLF